MEKVFERFTLYVHPKVASSMELQEFVTGNEIPLRIVNKKKDYPPEVRGIPALRDEKTGKVHTGSDAMERVDWLVNIAYDIQDVVYEYFQAQMSEVERGTGGDRQQGGGVRQGGASQPVMPTTVDSVSAAGPAGLQGGGAQLGNMGKNLGPPASDYNDSGGKITQADIDRMMQARNASMPKVPGR